jgi:4-amino-4-deoxy-L-arabinose transferase-like glycosyltransferase
MKLGLPAWTPSLVLSAAAVGLFYLLLTELLGGWSAILGVVLLLSVRMFRRLSIAYMSQPLFLVATLAAILAYVRWRRTRRAGWMAVVGACVGVAAITRPLDAVCVALPLAVAILFDLRRLGIRKGVATIGVGAAAVAPFMALQLVCNRGITGHWLETPWTFYARHDDPYDAMGRRAVTADVRTRSIVPQKRLAEEQFTIPAHRQRMETPFFELFLHKRLQYVMDDALPWLPLLGLIPIGLLALRRPGRAALWAGLPLLALGYTFHTVYLSQYAVAAAPATIFAVLCGAYAASRSLRPAAAAADFGELSRAVTAVLSCVLLAAAVSALPEVSGSRTDEYEGAVELRRIDRALAPLADAPSIVLFKFGPGANPLAEPVYNTDVAWPDDARVIRAHDLGDAANRRLMAYYAARQPGRRVYRYDRTANAAEPLTYLGTVRELVK